MKKGRHRRFEEARALKRGPDDIDIEGILNNPGYGPLGGPDPDRVSAELADEDDEFEDYQPGSWNNPEVD